jgi:hypothetical protein
MNINETIKGMLIGDIRIDIQEMVSEIKKLESIIKAYQSKITEETEKKLESIIKAFQSKITKETEKINLLRLADVEKDADLIMEMWRDYTENNIFSLN